MEIYNKIVNMREYLKAQHSGSDLHKMLQSVANLGEKIASISGNDGLTLRKELDEVKKQLNRQLEIS